MGQHRFQCSCSGPSPGVHGLLGLAPTDDTARLTALLEASGGSDLVLTPTDEATYTRTASRVNAMWGLSNGLGRFPS
jgi:hypothetical protein